MTNYYILNAQNEPVATDDARIYYEWRRTADRSVGLTHIGDGWVSTIFTGRGETYGTDAPYLYETLVFRGPLDGVTNRYHTRAEALAGHEAMVSRVRAAMGVRA